MINKNGLKQISSRKGNITNINKTGTDQPMGWLLLESLSEWVWGMSLCSGIIHHHWESVSVDTPCEISVTGVTWVAVTPVTWSLPLSLHSLASAIVSRFLSRGFYCFYQKKFGKDDGQHFSMCQLWLFSVCVSSKSGKRSFLPTNSNTRIGNNSLNLDTTLYQELILWVFG